MEMLIKQFLFLKKIINFLKKMNPLIIMTPMNQNYQGVANNIHNNQYAYHFNTFNQEEYNRERS